VYNNVFHTSLNMTPNEAMLEEDWLVIREVQIDNIQQKTDVKKCRNYTGG
jgi:hypothetical protein